MVQTNISLVFAVIGWIVLPPLLLFFIFVIYHLFHDDDIKRIVSKWYKVEHYVEMGSCDNYMHWVQCLDKGKPNHFDSLEEAQEFLDFSLDRFRTDTTLYRIVKVTEEVVY